MIADTSNQLNFNQLNFDQLNSLKHTSDSSIESSDKLIDAEKESRIALKFLELENIVGKELFESLTYFDKVFMAETTRSIDFGHAVDLKKISQEIKNYDVL